MAEDTTNGEPALEPVPPAAPAVEPVGLEEDEVPFDAYWRLRMEGATSRLKAVQEIITHKYTRGTFAESLLREVIAEFLPQRYAAATGFIMDRPRRSNQIDILVYDQLTESPVFRDGGFVVLTPGTAKLAIEVKSNLTGAEKDGDIQFALDNIRSAKRVDPRVYGFVFGFSGNESDTFVKHVKKWGTAPAPVIRTLWPDRAFNLAKGFTMSPTTGTLSDGGRLQTESTHDIYPDDAVVRTFLTTALQAIGLANLRSVLTAEPIAEPTQTF